MLSYCLKCRKNTESKNPKVVKAKNGRTILSSNCAICGSEKPRFNPSVLLSSLRRRAP